MSELTYEKKLEYCNSVENAKHIMDNASIHANTIINVYKDRLSNKAVR